LSGVDVNTELARAAGSVSLQSYDIPADREARATKLTVSGGRNVKLENSVMDD